MRVVVWKRWDTIGSWNVFLSNDMGTFSLVDGNGIVFVGTVVANVPIRIRSNILTCFAEQDLQVSLGDAVMHVPGNDAHFDGRTLTRLLL